MLIDYSFKKLYYALMNDNLLVHKHLIVRAEVYRPPMDEKFLTGWLNEFIEKIGMKVKIITNLFTQNTNVFIASS